MSIATEGLNLLNAILSGPAAAKTPATDESVQSLKKTDVAPTRAAVQSAVEQLQSYVKSVNRAVEFKVDAATGMTVVTVTDSKSGEVIRQMPSDEALWLAAHIGTKQSALLSTVA